MGCGLRDLDGETELWTDVSEELEGSLHFFDASDEYIVVRISEVEVPVASCFDLEYKRLHDN